MYAYGERAIIRYSIFHLVQKGLTTHNSGIDEWKENKKGLFAFFDESNCQWNSRMANHCTCGPFDYALLNLVIFLGQMWSFQRVIWQSANETNHDNWNINK